MSLFGNLFGQIFGDSAAEYEARGDQFAGVNNWRRAHEEYERALQKTSRTAPGFRRVAAKLEESRIQAFESLIEDIHSRIDVREFTYANELLDLARELTETSSQLAQVEACEERLLGTGRYEPRAGKAARPLASATLDPSARLDRGAATPVKPPAARVEPSSPGQSNRDFLALLQHLPQVEIEKRRRLGSRYETAALAIAADDTETAIPLLEALQRENPDLPFLFYDYVQALVKSGEHGEAQRLYAERIERYPAEWQARYELIQSLRDSQQEDVALRLAEESVELHPRSGHLMVQWGNLLNRHGRSEEALEKLYRALQLDEFDDAGLYHTIANVHRQRQEADKAQRAYLKALELNADSIGTMLDYAEFLVDQKEDGRAALAILDTAFRALRGVSGENVFHVYASYLSSRAHMLVGEREMALLAVTRALEDNRQEWLTQRLEDQRQHVLSV